MKVFTKIFAIASLATVTLLNDAICMKGGSPNPGDFAGQFDPRSQFTGSFGHRFSAPSSFVGFNILTQYDISTLGPSYVQHVAQPFAQHLANILNRTFPNSGTSTNQQYTAQNNGGFTTGYNENARILLSGTISLDPLSFYTTFPMMNNMYRSVQADTVNIRRTGTFSGTTTSKPSTKGNNPKQK